MKKIVITFWLWVLLSVIAIFSVAMLDMFGYLTKPYQAATLYLKILVVYWVGLMLGLITILVNLVIKERFLKVEKTSSSFTKKSFIPKSNPIVETTTKKHVEYINASFLDADLAGYTTPGWYFWDELSAYCYGPYSTYIEAEDALARYCDYLSGKLPGQTRSKYLC